MINKSAILASVLGFVGGVMGYLAAHAVGPEEWTRRPAAAVVRAQGFELLDAGGKTVGRWGAEGKDRVALALLDAKGNRTVELSESDGNQALVFYQDKTWIRMSLVAGITGMSALHLGDFNREARICLGAIEDGDLPSTQPPSEWGLVLRGPHLQTYLRATVNGKFRSGRERTSIQVLRPEGTYWRVP